ncbi:RluA family pseudouridine synthase [Pelomonas sp. SE-A7]|uniref:RluA family pseudouridine synthase n=1 Tax=Pelomonas sp. SE-A7 TaxID=3054953 RepID=UPI00259CD570|nr:RluA family pseudouridine synthase [Pelomonas sp. SE-A7]MDM4767077.1 RluA family pseudouridine synthase [Pelomonas sp. SE-A7]
MKHELGWLFEDGRCLVVDKPAGLLSVPGRGEDKQDCASSRVQQRHADALIVHRLDQATSGLLLFARGAEMQRAFSYEFMQRRVHKRYLAVVEGLLQPLDGEWREIDLPLIADWPNRPLQKIDQVQGKPSRTRWRVLAHEGGRSRVELEPVTGRSHQLRVHLQAIGHPIVGDALYGSTEGEPRLLLHACELALPEAPGGAISVVSPAPF